MTALWALTRWPPWLVMTCIALSLLVTLKTTVLADFLKAAHRRVSFFEVSTWYLGWPGLNARDFFSKSPMSGQRVSAGEWMLAVGKTGVGLALLLVLAPSVARHHALAGGWVAMVGIVLLLHFGGFHLLALGWRCAGRAVQPIMHAPLLATSVGDFWSNRWNLAFRDFATAFVLRPLARRWNARLALWGCFVFSGLVHELAISVPAGGGYGLPTAYFLLQAWGASFERSAFGKRTGIPGRLFTIAIVGPPAFFLFHPSFVLNVILPLVAMGTPS